MLQCEFYKRKQTWIKSLSRPVMPTEDVERLGDDMVFDYVKDEERWLCRRRCTCTPSLQLQGFVLAESFFQGLPRHRPPNQNGFSRAYVARHLGFVTKTQTLYTLMENVMAAAARGGKFWQM